MLVRVLPLTAVMGLPTCGGNVSDRETFSSGLPRNAVLADLSPAHKELLCESGRAYQRNAGGSSYCKFKARQAVSLAHTVSDETETEAEVRQACIDAEARYKSGPGSDAPPCQAPALVGPCYATVGDYEACVMEILGDMRRANETAHDCSELTLEDVVLPTVRPDFVEGPACRTLGEHCISGSPK